MFLFIILLVLVFISLIKFNRTSLQSTHRYHASLQSLKIVTITKCDKLKSIFSICVVQSLLHLEKLTVDECDELEQVFDFPQKVAELEVPFLFPFFL